MHDTETLVKRCVYILLVALLKAETILWQWRFFATRFAVPQ